MIEKDDFANTVNPILMALQLDRDRQAERGLFHGDAEFRGSSSSLRVVYGIANVILDHPMCFRVDLPQGGRTTVGNPEPALPEDFYVALEGLVLLRDDDIKGLSLYREGATYNNYMSPADEMLLRSRFQDGDSITAYV